MKLSYLNLSALSLVFFTASACSTMQKGTETPSSLPPEQIQAEKAAAKKTIMALGGGLKGELQKAMKSGGPVAAIGVCNLQAMPITDQVSQSHGAKISRTSLKLRNPKNAPSAWEKQTLEEFDARLAKGEKPMEIAKADVVMIDGKKVFRMMKAIPTGKVCTKCHGDQLNPKVAKSISELYPEDKATGYKVGQIRGAFSYQKTL